MRIGTVPALFALTLFLSAGLLFLIQPMVGKMVLPLLGGSPAVWNTCMVFFQTLLLLGYIYAHKLTSLKSTKQQVVTHLAVLALSLIALGAGLLFTQNHSAIPVLTSFAPEGGNFPFFNVLLILLVAVGVPFFAVATTAPLLQRWFGFTGHQSAKDPYFLYAASNAGSLLSLVSYPFLTEPMLRVVEQTWVFAAGFGLLAVFIAMCGVASLNPMRPPSLLLPQTEFTPVPELRSSRKWRWFGLAFIPSSLMLGVTNHLTTDIASIPLLWVVPLALYLFSFVIAFARGSDKLIPLLSNLSPVVTLLLIFSVTSSIGLSVFVQIALHLMAYFLSALLLHTELAALRPDTKYLTTFYIWMSFGGVAGGIFNSLIAPIAFPHHYEYAIAIIIGCFLLPRGSSTQKIDLPKPDPRQLFKLIVTVVVPLIMITLSMGLRIADSWQWVVDLIFWLTNKINSVAMSCGVGLRLDTSTVRSFLIFAPTCLLSFLFIDRPVRFGLAIASIFFVHHYIIIKDVNIRETRRSFFGVLQIRNEPVQYQYNGESIERPFHMLSHGTTIHGRQFAEDIPGRQYGEKSQPLTYYHRTGPVGDLVQETVRLHPNTKIGVVGLGTGSMAAYANRGQSFDFYEIDQLVVRLVEPPTHFTYLSEARARGAEVNLVMGDARLTLAKNVDKKYHLLLIDAFSSDAIPIHLMTVEALKMYKERLTDDGLLTFHVSNRYLRLEPVVAALAKECGMSCRVRTDSVEEASPGTPPGRTSCTWIVLAKSPEQLNPAFTIGFGSEPAMAAVVGGATYAAPSRWIPLETMDGVDAWTDDYASVPQVIRSKEFQWFRRQLGFIIPNLE
jgi:hypothetical protein